ncbi:MAG: hypothetical protein RSB23_06600 [Alistipes sp.]
MKKNIIRWWHQLWCHHNETGVHSFPFSYQHNASAVRYGIWQRKVCLHCGKVLERGHAWRDGLSMNKVRASMRALGNESRVFAKIRHFKHEL